MFYNKFNSKPRANVPERKTYPRQCRYCGADIFYHTNEYGSRVLFDDLGSPWPRHECWEFSNTDPASLYISGIGEKHIYWVRRGHNNWYLLDNISAHINSLHYNGIYIIWYFDALHTARTVKVGKGALLEQLQAERKNPQVREFADRTLYVTWALVPPHHIDKVTDSLTQKLEPFAQKQQYSRNTDTFVKLPATLTWCY